MEREKSKTMDNELRDILKKAREALVTRMDARQVLLKMSASSVFSERNEEDIKAMPEGQKQSEKLLEILPRRGAHSFYIFKNAIREVHPHLIQYLSEPGK